MRFLCLHGRGTNSDIFEAQLVALRSRLSPEHQFDFVDAEVRCPAAPGIAALYPPPYLCWHAQGTPADVQESHSFLETIIEEDGPYDGLIGFSEGAALAASFLLCDEMSSSPPRFKIGILFNSVIPLSPSKTVGCSLQELVPSDQDSYLDLLVDPASATGSKRHLSQAYGFSGKGHRRISIPTVHIIGMKDPFVDSSRAVLELCQPKHAEVLLHEGGHELPRTEGALNRCAQLFEAAVGIATVTHLSV